MIYASEIPAVHQPVRLAGVFSLEHESE